MECTQSINTTNAERAKRERPGVTFGELYVTITAIDRVSQQLRFTTRGQDDRDHPFTCSLREVWLECPSTAQQVGDHGTLKITRAGLDARSDADGTTPIKNAFLVDPKWPDRAAAGDPLTAVEIWPLDVIVEGYAQGDPNKRARISLLDARLCGPEQRLRLDAASALTLSLTPDGLNAFGILEDSLSELAWAVEELGKAEPEARSVARSLAAVEPRSAPAPRGSRASLVVARWRSRVESGLLPDGKLAAVRELLKLAA